MCGRYVNVAERGRLLEVYRATAVEPLPGPSYNVAPTQTVTIVIDHADKNPARRRVNCERPGGVWSWLEPRPVRWRSNDQRTG
jgi:putative SOS response-associated peptidase YedK